MPLQSDGREVRLTPRNQGKNISRLIVKGYPQKQAVAISYSEMRSQGKKPSPKSK